MTKYKSNSSPLISQRASKLAGEASALAERLGRAELTRLARVHGAFDSGQVQNAAGLRQFLHDYAERVLVTHELPVILQAWGHARRGELRELVALDQQLGSEPALQSFAKASHRVGRGQLRKLHPLRDHRLVQRYLAAVQAGEAKGWHTIVYGMVLALFSLPLRQGLLHYAGQTLGGFVGSAARPLQLTEAECEAALGAISQTLPDRIETLLAAGFNGLRLLP